MAARETGAEPTTTTTTTYAVDASLVITSVGGAWETFAAGNGGRHLTGPNVVGRPLLDFVSDDTTRFLFRALFERARAQRGPVEVPFRCDSPGLRRRMTLAIRAAGDQSLAFEARLDRVEPRLHVPLLDPFAPRGEGFVRMCSWCKKVHAADDIWLEVEDAVTFHALFDSARPPLISHGICPDCVADLQGRLS